MLNILGQENPSQFSAPIAFPIAFIIGIIWLILISQLMITDVWDETTGRLILAGEPVNQMSIAAAIRTIWLYELPLDLYRPMGSSLFIILGKLFDGNIVILRYFNALLLLVSASVVALTMYKNKVSTLRVVVFFLTFLFSSAAFITAGWSANIFDASCLFFLSMAFWLLSNASFLLAGLSLAAAVFCKEAYVLFMPLLVLLVVESPKLQTRKLVIPMATLVTASLIYWIARNNIIPVGSDADIHGFESDQFAASLLSFLGGFPFQFSKFTPGSLHIWVGILVLTTAIVFMRDRMAQATAVVTILFSAVVYWGMFGYQSDLLISADNFVGRLYLIPFCVVLYLIVRHARFEVALLFACSSLIASTLTFRDHISFQNVYAEIYEVAADMDDTLVVHYPFRELNDPIRNIVVGDYPDADYRIDTIEGRLASKR